MSIECKIFITDPYTFMIIKSNSKKLENFQELYNENYVV